MADEEVQTVAEIIANLEEYQEQRDAVRFHKFVADVLPT
jgi:hypothetical protein